MLLVCLLNFKCASVPDVPACIELGPNKGWCTYTISDKEFFVDDDTNELGKEWWDMRPQMIMLPWQSWAKIKSYIQKKCKKHNDCKGVAGWDKRVERIDEMVGR